MTERPFEVALTDMICCVNGRRARSLDATSTENGWSRIVDDLIRHTARAVFKRQNAYVSRNQEPLRGEDAVRAVNAAMGPNSPFLIRSSFGKILSIFDPELAELGKKIEWEGKAFEEDQFKKAHERRYSTKERGNDLPPPPLGSERPGSGDDDSGGCSFVIMDFTTE